MKNKLKRILSFTLCLVMVLSMFPQLSTPVMAAGDPNYSFGTTNSGDGWNRSTGLPTSCSGKAVLALFFNGDTFPGEPRTHSGANYVSYNTSFEKGSGNFKASEILQNVLGSSSYVMGENSKLFSYYLSATSGIFDPNGLDDEYFTDNFRAALDAREQSMIADVIAAKKDANQAAGSENPADYEIVWYVIKYQTIDSTWHINGLIREKDKYSVIYDGNGAAAGSPPDGVIDMSYSDALNYTVQGNNNGLGRGNAYEFVGWNTKADGSGIFYSAGQKADLTVVGDNPITLYAQWKEKSKVTVTWKDGNGEGSIIHVDADLAAGDQVTVYDGATPTKASDANHVYTFNGKWTDKNGNEVTLPITMGSDSITLYAQFDSSPRTYTVTWVNHTVIDTDTGLSYGASVSYGGEIPTRSTTETEGYLFAGWSTTENGAVEYALRDPVTVNGDMALYAQFTLVPMRTVTWYSEDGNTVLATQRVLEGSAVSYPNAAPVKAGNIFAGWAAAANGTAVYAAGAPITVSGNMNLYVDFEPTKHTVTWKDWDGTVLETDANVPYGDTPEYNGATPVRADDVDKTYTFIGWTPAVNTVTGDITYTASYTDAPRAYTVTWNNFDNTLLKNEPVNYGVTPVYTGSEPVRPETSTHTFTFIGWMPAVSAVTGDVTYTAEYQAVEKLFEAKVYVWEDPEIDATTGAVTSGALADLSGLTAYNTLYLRDVEDHSKIYPLTKSATGTYTANLAHGSYDVVVENGENYERIIEERIVLPMDTASSDPDSTTADIIFYSVTYDFADGTFGGQSSKVEYYQRGTDVTVSAYKPTRSQYIFDNWQLDDNATDTYLANQRITVYDSGIIGPHTLTAKWIRANDNVVVNLTIHHHADPALSGAIGMNPHPGSVQINLDLTRRPEGGTGDYWEEGKKFSSSNWFSAGTTTEGTASHNGTEYATKTTTITFDSSTTGFEALSHVWDYSANILLEDYFLTERTVTETEGANGDVTYTVNAVLQYRPDLFNLGYAVEIHESVPDELVPTAVDLKILSYKNGAWSPISRHQSTSVEARFENRNPVSGSYAVPVKDQQDNDFYYRVAVVGFTMPDGTELSASGGLVNYHSDATGTTATYQYALGAYTAVVTVTSDKAAADGSAGVYGGGSQADGTSILVTVYANAHTVTFDPNGGKLSGSTEALVVPNQFRIPVLGNYVPTREGGYVFDGWQLNGSAAVTGTPITENVTLTAKWKEPLTVSGEVRVSTTDSHGNALRSDGLPTSLSVTLERTTASGDKIIVQSKTYPLTESDYTSGLGVVSYAFAPVEQDGSSYQVYVNVTNYNTAFLNEPGSNAAIATDLDDPAKYTGSRDAVDSDGNSDALVYAYLIFDPQEFNLTWQVDTTAIGDSFRPDSLDIVARCDGENDTSVPFDDWEPIIQHYSNGVYTPERTVIGADGTATGFYPVWTVHPEGYAFDYAVKIHKWIKDDIEHNLTADTPFTATYDPAIAWYNGTKQVTANPSQDHLLITLNPKSYAITYELNAGADPVQGLNGEPTSHTWSHVTTGIPQELSRDGYDFLGWTCNIAGAYADGKIKAEVAEDITLTAQWRQQKVVTFKVVNGTWGDNSTADIVSYVSLDSSNNGSVDIPAGMQANYGYGNGSWNDAALTGDTLAVTGSEAVTYIYSYERLYHSVSYDTDGKNGVDASDTVAHGNYIRVDPASGEWNGSTSVKDIQIEDALELSGPVRSGYVFAGWHRHYTEDTTTYPGSTVTHRYVAQWLRDENGDGIADTLQKKIIFMIENGTWDGTNSDPIAEFVTLDGSGKADISSVIPTGMHPRTGFVAENAFWSPALPAGNIVSGNGEVSYTYHHYTTITYSDFTQNGNPEQLLILPGSYIGIDPAGGSWDGNTSNTITQINGPYVLEDAVYTNHDFLGWQLNTASGEAAHIFTAQWKKDSYTILWKNDDGTLLETDENIELGTTPEYNSATPTKASTAEFDYTFKGWTPEVIAAEENTTYTAEFTATRRSYTVTWLNWDGNILDTDTVEYGQIPSFASIPSRPASDEYTYTFSGWDNTPAAVTEDVTYTATYSQTTNQYTVTWLDEDGTEPQSGLVDYGTMPTAPADPTKAATAQYTYTFSGWSPAVASVTGDAVYRAAYSSTVNKYTVTWYEEDGVTVIETEEVEYGKVPLAPAAAAKENTEQYSYTFSGWKNGETTYIPASIPAVTGEVSYIAQYAQTTNKYTVTWKDFNGSVLEEDALVEYGAAPSFSSTSKLTTEDANSDYKFLGWYLSTDAEKTVVDLAAQTVTGNVTYIAKYNVSSKARTVTINVWVNATAADGTGGAPSTIGTVTNGQRGNMYLVPEASANDAASFIQASWNDTAKAYTASLMPGNYLIYAGDTAADAVREANQIVSIVNTNVTVNTLYNSVTYNAGEGSFEGGQKTLTEYYKSGSGPVYVSKTIPTLGGKVFTHWHDEADTVYNASTTAVPVKLTDKITTGYTLSAHWSDAADIQVIVNIDTVDENSQPDTGFTGKTLSLQLAGKPNGSDSSVPYAAIYGTDISSQYSSGDSAWTVSSGVYTFTKTYANQRSDYVYQATALMKNYALENISVDGNTVTIDLKYDPAGFDLEFKVVVDENVPDELVPRAVDVQIVFFDRETGAWKMLSNTQNKALEVMLEKDGEGKWSGTGSYHVWSKYTSGSFADQLYLYRIAITDFDLGTNRGSLMASSADFKTYSSAVGYYHPAGAYTAEVTVVDLSCSNGTAGGLLGSHDSDGTQHGTITATVNVAAYDVVKYYNDAANNVVTVEDRFLTPELDTPTYAGHTFAGWWTKDGTGGDWGKQVTAAGTAIKSLVNSGSTLNLYARWNQDLTVSGEVKVSNEYQGSKLYDHDRPETVRVELRNAQTNALVSSTEVTLTDDISDEFRSGNYTFHNVPDNGASYRISVVAPNYTVLFRNETVATDAAYSDTLYAAVDNDDDDKAVVDVYMEFTPHNFDLEYTVDATNIGKDFRPTVAGVVVLSGDSSEDPQSWDIIAQQLDGENVNAHEVAIDAATGKPADSDHDGASGIWHHYPVWRRSPFGDLYEYAIQLWTVQIGDTTYGRNAMASAPFSVIYTPAHAWYDAETGKQTAPPVTLSSGITLTHPDSGNPHGLVAYIVPKSYTVTYELGRTGTVSGVTSIDGNTARGSFLWSHGLTELPEATPTGASGVTFGGWWTKDGTNGDWGTQVTSIGADTAENRTLYARWKYTITWNAGNGSTPTTESILEDTVPTAPANPTKAADSQYSYAFTGWSPTIAAVVGNVTYTAQYSTSTNSYTVTWKNGDTVLDTDTVAYGEMPAYTGATPTKASTEQYSYTFSGWTPALATVTGDVTYNATFAQTERSYTVTWKNHDGSTLDVDANIGYGVLPSYDGATPSKTGDAQYSYSFSGWKRADDDTLYTAATIPYVTDNVTYTAQFEQSVNTYTVTWKNWDGSVLETDDGTAYGTMPTYDAATPTRSASEQLEYHYIGWDKEVETVTGNVVYTAQYYSTTRTYVVIWKDSDGTTLETDPAVPFGTTPKYDGETPTKTADAQYTYTFNKWSPDISSVTGDITYTASYSTTVNKYTVTWKNDNGDVLKSEHLDYGTMPNYGTTPAKAADAQFTYTFSGWTPSVETVTGTATYTAAYTETVNEYTVIWQNWDGTELEKDENVPYGTTPTYDGAAPTRDNTAEHTFTWHNWDKAVSPVTGDVIYTAVFVDSTNTYTIVWKDENGTVLETDTDVPYGSMPSFDGALPTKAGDAQYSYTHNGWSPTVQAVTGNAEYTAAFTQTVNSYTITWKDEDGTTLKTDHIEYGTVPSYAGTVPEKEATAEFSYSFTGWDTEPVAVTGEATYTATYSSAKRSYTITWQNEDGTELAVNTLEYGEMPSYTGSTPTKAATGRYTYTHSGWTPTVKSVTGNATYKATYTMQTNQYTITWKDDDGSVLRTDTLTYGDVPVYGTDPVKTGDAQYSYAFAGWTPAVQNVYGNAEYTATYAQNVNSYTVTYTDGVDAVELFADQSYTAEYGTLTLAFVGTPSRPGYSFNGWDPAVSDTVTGNMVYTAQWTANPIVPPAATGTAKLVKVDADDQSFRLKNVVFELHRADGTLLGEYKTDANGQITVSSLASGEYYWLETRPAEGYVLDSTKHSFTVSAGQTAAITVTNKHSEVPSAFSGDHYAYIVGYSDGKVHPEANITRAEVATIFFRLLDNETRERYLTKENTFSDVENGMWFNTAVSTMAAMGIINGYPDGDFHPNANITRAEFAAIAARFDSNANTTGVSFTDIYGHWAQKEINIAANNGWILGYENGEFRPNQNITRAEAMAMVNRVLQRIPESKEDLLDAMVKWPDNMDTTKWYYLTVQEATNSHDYGRKNNGYEYWTTIKEVPDWAALER